MYCNANIWFLLLLSLLSYFFLAIFFDSWCPLSQQPQVRRQTYIQNNFNIFFLFKPNIDRRDFFSHPFQRILLPLTKSWKSWKSWNIHSRIQQISQRCILYHPKQRQQPKNGGRLSVHVDHKTAHEVAGLPGELLDPAECHLPWLLHLSNHPRKPGKLWMNTCVGQPTPDLRVAPPPVSNMALMITEKQNPWVKP